jgi:hypothetical protein
MGQKYNRKGYRMRNELVTRIGYTPAEREIMGRINILENESSLKKELQKGLKERYMKETLPNAMAIRGTMNSAQKVWQGTPDETYTYKIDSMCHCDEEPVEVFDRLPEGVGCMAIADDLILGFFKPERIMYSGNVTICFWKDGTKTVVKTNEEPFVKEHGVAMAIVKHLYGSRSQFLKAVKNGYDPVEEAKKRAEEKKKKLEEKNKKKE